MKPPFNRFQWYICAHCTAFISAEHPNNFWCLNCNKQMQNLKGRELMEIIRRRQREPPASKRDKVQIKGLVPEEELLEMLEGL